MNEFTIIDDTPTRRFRWVYDEDYQTAGSYAYDTDEATEKAEQHELSMLKDGRWVALGCIEEQKCLSCHQWEQIDSIWGVVISPDKDNLREFAYDHFGGARATLWPMTTG